jgi:hypothetical protein
MVLLKLNNLEYPLQYITQIMDTHSCDGLFSSTLYTKHFLYSPFLYFDSTGTLISSYLVSVLPQLDLYACIGFLLAIRIPAGPHPHFGIYVVSKDTSSVEIEN